MAKGIEKISNESANEIKSIIDGWPIKDKLSWDALVIATSARMNGKTWSRVSLSKHKDIYDAYLLRKKAQRAEKNAPAAEGVPRVVSEEDTIAMQAIKRLEAEIERLKLDNSRWKERYVLISYNATSYNLTEEMLHAPLITVDRGATRK